jgi:hypothetical protein
MPKLLGIMAFCAFVAGTALAQDAPNYKALDGRRFALPVLPIPQM